VTPAERRPQVTKRRLAGSVEVRGEGTDGEEQDDHQGERAGEQQQREQALPPQATSPDLAERDGHRERSRDGPVISTTLPAQVGGRGSRPTSP
jgi:hypothetical protein